MEGTVHCAERSHTRYRVAARADLTGIEQVLLYHPIRDVSAGGLRYDAATPEPVGARVDVLLSFPRFDTEVPITGEVVWSSEQGSVGLRWVDLDDDAQDRLAYLLSYSKTAELSQR